MKHVKQLRELHGLSQNDLCEYSGLYPEQINYIENVQQDSIFGTIERVAKGSRHSMIATLMNDT